MLNISVRSRLIALVLGMAALLLLVARAEGRASDAALHEAAVGFTLEYLAARAVFHFHRALSRSFF